MVSKKDICQAFCQFVEVSTFSGGLAVSTPYLNHLGDPIGIYLLGNDGGPYRIIDNAMTVAYLEAEGATLDSSTRQQAFVQLLNQYGASYDAENGELFIDAVSEAKAPKAILDFSALLLRLNDMLLLTPERAASTFTDDVKKALLGELSGNVPYTEGEPVSDTIKEVIPDLTFYPEGRDPVALFIVTSEPKIWQAIHLRMVADHEAHVPLSIMAVLETDNSVTSSLRVQADNRLDAVPRFRNEPQQALKRMVTEIVGRQATVH